LYSNDFKFPDFDDLYYRSLDSSSVGNPKLRPEDGLGADIRPTVTLRIDRLGFTALTLGVKAKW
jgi:outer membrane receptor protein involved in Fe transport